MSNKKVALVTGANRGIGREIAKQLAESGFKVIIAARNIQKARAAASEIGFGSIAVMLNVADESSVSKAEQEISKQVDHIDVLVNNAGIYSKDSLLAFNIHELKDVMNTNFMGTIFTCKYFINLLEESNDARIINMSSGMGTLQSLQMGGFGAYRLSKALVNAFTISLAAELQDKSIKVFSVDPGWVQTDMGGKNAPLSVAEGADTAVWLASAKDVISGKFYANRKTSDW